MLKFPVKYIDSLNIGLIVLTCVMAHIFPYHLLLFSYAILGPAHYLTQISWLHDRRYFANTPLVAPIMGVLSFLLLAMQFHTGDAPQVVPATILSAAVCFAIISVLPTNKLMRRNVIVILGAFLILLVFRPPFIILLITILLPTVLHVFVFTAAFMWLGAIKSGRKTAYLSVFILLGGAGTFLLPSSGYGSAPDLEGLKSFYVVVDFLQKGGLSNSTQTQLFGFLSYAYTYHYLNWFSKAEVIRWNQISPERMKAIGIIYVLALASYACSYALGLLLTYLLSVGHVLLEFPLNLRTFTAIARGKT